VYFAWRDHAPDYSLIGCLTIGMFDDRGGYSSGKPILAGDETIKWWLGFIECGVIVPLHAEIKR